MIVEGADTIYGGGGNDVVIVDGAILEVGIGSGGINLELLGLNLLGPGGFGDPIGLPDLGL